jgi:hypothetical protein
MYHLFQYHSSTSSCNRTAVDANGHQCLAKRKMAPQEQGRYAWMLDNERFTDMTILLTTPGMLLESWVLGSELGDQFGISFSPPPLLHEVCCLGPLKTALRTPTIAELMHEAARLRPEASRVPAKRLRRSSAKGAAQQQVGQQQQHSNRREGRIRGSNNRFVVQQSTKY